MLAPMPSTTCRALLISPRCITGGTIMIYPNLREVLGCGYLMPPLGLLTVAALLPRSWDVRLIDHNFQKLTTEDLDQADIVMTGGMLTQQHDALEIIRLAHARQARGRRRARPHLEPARLQRGGFPSARRSRKRDGRLSR